jgi:hypothetical protein
MSAYVLEIKAVVLRGEGPVGYGVDEGGDEFAVAYAVRHDRQSFWDAWSGLTDAQRSFRKGQQS